MARQHSGRSRLRVALFTLWPALLLGSVAAQSPDSLAAPTSPNRPVSVRADSSYGALEETVLRLGIDGAHRLGLTGSGVRIGVLDGLFLLGHQALTNTTVLATRDFVDGDDDVTPGPGDPLPWAESGTAVLSLAGATANGVLLGPAFGGSFVLARTFSPEGAPRADETRWRDGLEWLASQGVRVIVTGGGFRSFDDGFSYEIEDLDGLTAVSTISAAQAAARGVLVVSPMGDLGPGEGTLSAPADGVDVLAVGAVGPTGSVAGFSGTGPTGDGRPKPDALAPGVDVPAAGVESNVEIAETTGTATAAALVAGSAALFIEAYPGRSPEAISRALALSASGRPEMSAGAALIDVGSAIAFPDGVTALPLAEVDGNSQVTTLTPLFEWDAPTIFPRALPVGFTILISPDSTFERVILSERVVGTFARRLSRALPARQTIYWRIEAETTQRIRRTTSTEGPLFVPPWVELTVLDDPGGQTITERRPTFKWEPFELLAPPAGPFTYDLTIFNDRDEVPVAEASGLDSLAFRVPDPLPVNVPLRWSIVARDPLGGADTATSAGPFVVVSSANPPVTVLYQNFPNPFPSSENRDGYTRVWFDLAVAGAVELSVFDLRGRLIRRMIPAAGCAEVTLEAGLYGRDERVSTDPCIRLEWDARDDSGNTVPTGVYLLRLKAGGINTVRRVVYWP